MKHILSENLEKVKEVLSWRDVKEPFHQEDTWLKEKVVNELKRFFEKPKLIVEEKQKVMKGVIQEFEIKGDSSSLTPLEFFKKANPIVIDLMKQNPKTKVRMICHVLVK